MVSSTVKTEKWMNDKHLGFGHLSFFQIKKTSESDLLFEPFFPARKLFEPNLFLDFQHFQISNHQTRDHF